jgi:hypothetical protein
MGNDSPIDKHCQRRLHSYLNGCYRFVSSKLRSNVCKSRYVCKPLFFCEYTRNLDCRKIQLCARTSVHRMYECCIARDKYSLTAQSRSLWFYTHLSGIVYSCTPRGVPNNDSGSFKHTTSGSVIRQCRSCTWICAYLYFVESQLRWLAVLSRLSKQRIVILQTRNFAF